MPSHTPDSPRPTWVTNSALIWDTVGATIFLGWAGAVMAALSPVQWRRKDRSEQRWIRWTSPEKRLQLPDPEMQKLGGAEYSHGLQSHWERGPQLAHPSGSGTQQGRKCTRSVGSELEKQERRPLPLLPSSGKPAEKHQRGWGDVSTGPDRRCWWRFCC